MTGKLTRLRRTNIPAAIHFGCLVAVSLTMLVWSYLATVPLWLIAVYAVVALLAIPTIVLTVPRVGNKSPKGTAP
jgi:membrane protein YdbS with pleckstrin-like domain